MLMSAGELGPLAPGAMEPLAPEPPLHATSDIVRTERIASARIETRRRVDMLYMISSTTGSTQKVWPMNFHRADKER